MSLAPGWRPPPEPNKPPVPYKKGYRFTARRVKSPSPFLGRYAKVPTGTFDDFLREFRFPKDEFLRNTTLVDYCLSASSRPLPCESLGETARFEISDEISVGDGPRRGRGPQVFTCTREGEDEGEGSLVAKVFDPLYYPFSDSDFPSIPNDVIALSEHDFALESAAYMQLDPRLGGGLIPRFYGSWVLEQPLKHLNRSVCFILLEKVKGVPLSAVDPKLCTQEERLRALASAMEADLALRFAGVVNNDVAPRNIMCCPDGDLGAENLWVRIVDFNATIVLSALGIAAPCESDALPESPIKWFERSWPVDLREWVPEGWGDDDWKRWLREKWQDSPRHKPIEEK